MRNRIRIVSEDGFKVDITDAQTGAVIPGVRGVTFKAPRPGDLATVELDCLCAKVDVIGELAAIEFVTVHGERRRFVLPVGSREVPPAPAAEALIQAIKDAGEIAIARIKRNTADALAANTTAQDLVRDQLAAHTHRARPS